MTLLQQLYQQMVAAMGVARLEIPTTAVKFYRHEDEIPAAVLANKPTTITLTSCQAAKQASLGDAVLLTLDNIGCVAAAISLGLVDQNQDTPLCGSRVYTDLMLGRARQPKTFAPPTPQDFTTGQVYASRAADRPEFNLFGPEDSGRYQSVETAERAIAEMMAIQPAVMKGVFLYALDFDEIEIVPDVVVCSVRPVELTRLIQAYQYLTGRRVNASIGALRVVNSDLIVRPYLTQEINVSTYCLGARLIAQYEADRLGIGMPFHIFEMMVHGMEASQTGYPFQLYPGAGER